MDVMHGLGEKGSGTDLTGVDNLMLHFTPYAEDWSKLPVIVSGEGCHVTDDKGDTYIDGLAGLFTTQVGHGREELAKVAAEQMRQLGFFPNWSFQHPRSLELAKKISEIAPGDLNSTASEPLDTKNVEFKSPGANPPRSSSQAQGSSDAENSSSGRTRAVSSAPPRLGKLLAPVPDRAS